MKRKKSIIHTSTSKKSSKRHFPSIHKASPLLAVASFSTRPTSSYFEKYPQVTRSTLSISPQTTGGSGQSTDKTKRKTSKIEKEVHLGKHKTKRRRDTLQNVSISKSLALALQTGKLPTMFEHGNDKDPNFNDFYASETPTATVEDLGLKINMTNSHHDIIPEYQEPQKPSNDGNDMHMGLGVAANWFPGMYMFIRSLIYLHTHGSR